MNRQNRSERSTGLEALRDCTLCPRECHADRSTDRLGYCQSGMGFGIGSICLHRGEEPVLSGDIGICNVFFTRCNMQCVYCQNAQISRNRGRILEQRLTLVEVVGRIEQILDQGSSAVGFVSPSHCIPQMMLIIKALRQHGRTATVVMNTNAYDRVETLVALEGSVDVYLPDFKYMDGQLAASYSDTPDYPAVALAALKEMVRQMGTQIELDGQGRIRSGLIVRHLVLPGHVANSKQCLRAIAETLSPAVHLSLMAQYHPTSQVASHPCLGRPLHRQEYEEVLDEMDRLGFQHGWVQELESERIYLPDFSRVHPFAAA